jgi:hypothetical protein
LEFAAVPVLWKAGSEFFLGVNVHIKNIVTVVVDIVVDMLVNIQVLVIVVFVISRISRI